MKTQLPVLAGLLLLGLATFIDGLWCERWIPHQELEVMAARIENVPMQFGEWQGEAGEAQDPAVLKAAGAIGSLTRNYRDAHKESVSVFLIYGRPGSIYIHSPDKCYAGAGFEPVSAPTTESVETSTGVAKFGVSTFKKTDAKGAVQMVRVYWGYAGENGEWLAPDNLKLQFGGQWGVYKMYVIVPIANLTDTSAEEIRVHSFIREVLPEINRTLFEPAAKDESGSVQEPAADADPAANPEAERVELGLGPASEK